MPVKESDKPAHVFLASLGEPGSAAVTLPTWFT
jgi:hypothetical protein